MYLPFIKVYLAVLSVRWKGIEYILFILLYRIYIIK